MFCKHKNLSAPRKLYPTLDIGRDLFYQSCRDCGEEWEYSLDDADDYVRFVGGIIVAAGISAALIMVSVIYFLM